MKIFDSKLDGRYDIFVEWKAPYKGELVIMDDKKELLREETDIMFDAKFGPDISDVEKWQNRAAEFVDNMNKPKEEEDLPLLSNRHYNKAKEDLGKVYRVSTNPTDQYPEIGCVEVQNAIKLLASAYSTIEHLQKKVNK